MSYSVIHKITTIFISLIWLSNGLICKLMDLVPRHKQIVAHVLPNQNSYRVTTIIGLLEVLMAIWVTTKIKFKLNAIIQILTIAIMNSIEYTMTPNLLLWGKLNSVFALLFMILIYYNAFVLAKKTTINL